MTEHWVRLRPRGPFHLGERGIGYEETAEFVHADTLFGALCAAWTVLYGEQALEAELLPPQPTTEDWQPPFLISSAFPFAGPVRFYPPPRLDQFSQADRRWRDVEWASEQVFRAWLRGAAASDVVWLHGNSTVLTRSEAEELARHLEVRAEALERQTIRQWAHKPVPRVTLDGLTQASELWHFGRVWFREGCGLFFLVKFLRGIEERFHAALRLLGDVGIGGDRSAGHGLFEPVWEELPWPWTPTGGPWFVTLSPVFPTPAQVRDLLRDGCRYRLLTRTGWIGGAVPTPYRRRAVRMLAEGSVLGGDPAMVWGAMADVTPDSVPEPMHAVFRWGYAFPVPCGVNRP